MRTAQGGLLVRQATRPLLIEGYASIFGEEDLTGDVVRAGAFARSLARFSKLPMLLQHRVGAVAGRWVRVVEDGRGLYVRGLIETDSGRALVGAGLDGLSIGFRPLMWQRRAEGGRLLTDVDLVEVSLVAEPMLPSARFTQVAADIY